MSSKAYIRMKAREVLEDKLLCDEPVRMQFFSKAQLHSFKCSMHTMLRRMNKQGAKIGLDKINEDKVLCCSVLSESLGLIVAEFEMKSMKEAKRTLGDTGYIVIPTDASDTSTNSNDPSSTD